MGEGRLAFGGPSAPFLSRRWLILGSQFGQGSVIATLITDDCLKRNPAITYLLSKTSLPITQLNEKRAALGLPRFCV